MHKFVCLAVVLVGCGEIAPVVMYDAGDAGFAGDSSYADAWQEVDGGQDAPDAAAPTDAGVDTSDAYVGADLGTADAAPDGSAPADAGADAPRLADAGALDAGAPAASALGVSGNTSCVLAGTQMWCWGGGVLAPQYIAEAVELNGNCAIGTDARVFCWTADSGVTYASAGVDYGSNAVVLGPSEYAATDGNVHRWQSALAFAPSEAIESMPTQHCYIGTNGSVHCWDVVRSGTTYSFQNFWGWVDGAATYDATDLGRVGNLGDNTFAGCFTWVGTMPGAGSSGSGPGVVCSTSMHNILTPTWVGATQVEMEWGRACVMMADGVHCTSATPASFTSDTTFNALPAGDPVGSFTAQTGQLELGMRHACVLRAGQVWCWGANDVGQLGDGTTGGAGPTRAW